MKDIVDIIASLLPGISPFDALLLLMLVLTRWLMMTITMAFLGSHLLPGPVRMGLAALLSIVCFVIIVDKQTFFSLTVMTIALLFVKEAFLGLLIGFFASLLFYAYELIGELIDFSRAATMGRLLVPELKHQSSAMGVLLFQLCLVMFIGFGFHRDVIKSAVESFVVFPPLSLNDNLLSSDLLSLSVRIMETLFEMALRFALPIMVVSFLIDLAFGLMNRVAPQINAYFLSLPAKMLGGLIIVFLILPFLIDDYAEHYYRLSHFFFWREH